MLNYISFAFLLLLPVLVGITYLLPVKARSLFFLLAGACLYASMGIRFLPVLFLAVCSTYLGGRLCEQQGGEVNREKDERSKLLGQRRMALVLCIGFNLSFLFVFKYLRLFAPGMAVAAPFGISFFVLTGLGYVIDCYRGKYQAEKNFLTYAAFSSFFPLIASGPIERADHLIPQMKKPAPLSYRRLQSGMLLMIWGYFLKLVLANRLSILVQSGFENPQSQAGILLILSVLAFTFEIYCDFYGYSSIAKGCAALLGIEVMDNFKSPYLSGNIAEFWRRWHISLSSWFRDYLYIPLGGNRRGNLRRDRNLLIVFLVSGIWHGGSFCMGGEKSRDSYRGAVPPDLLCTAQSVLCLFCLDFLSCDDSFAGIFRGAESLPSAFGQNFCGRHPADGTGPSQSACPVGGACPSSVRRPLYRSGTGFERADCHTGRLVAVFD